MTNSEKKIKVIESLTPEQEALFPVYREKYLGLITNTKRISQETAQAISDFYYEQIEENKKKVPVLLVDSPFQAWKELSKIFGKKYNIEPEKLDYEHPYIDGHLNAAYFSFYDYINKVLGVEYPCQKKYDWYRTTLKIGHFYPLEEVCIISQKPIKYSFNDDGRVHGDGKPAIEYADGWSVYCLNGVNVPEYLAMTPVGILDINFFLECKNADVSAEFIKKYGAERLVDRAKLIDSYKNYDNLNPLYVESQYELYDFAQLHERWDVAMFLRMVCPTTGAVHVESVANNCKTIFDGLAFRMGFEKDCAEFREYYPIAIK